MATTQVASAGQSATADPDSLKVEEEKVAERMLDKEHEQHRLTLETWIRGAALMLVVIALVVYPMYALIFKIPGTALADVIAPVTGIAGAIVGYWFGQASRRIQTPPPSTPPPPPPSAG